MTDETLDPRALAWRLDHAARELQAATDILAGLYDAASQSTQIAHIGEVDRALDAVMGALLAYTSAELGPEVGS